MPGKVSVTYVLQFRGMASDAPPPVSQSAPCTPVIVRCAMDAAAELTRLRLERGWTGEDLDEHAGGADRYTGKLERPDAPWGKRGLAISPMWEVWAEALGVCLVIVPKELAERIGPRMPLPRPVITKGGCAQEAA